VTFRKLLIGALAATFALALPGLAAAQTGAAPRASSDESQGDVDAGVNVMRIRNRGVTEPFNKGFHAGVSYRIAHSISVFGDMSADFHALPDYTKHIYAYGGGVRFNSPRPHARIDPLVQLMVGWAQDNGTGDGHHNYYPFLSPAAGVDVGLAGGVSFRARVDFPLWMTFGDVFKGTRFSAGLSCRFGTRTITP
jgi:hypothetical protein